MWEKKRSTGPTKRHDMHTFNQKGPYYLIAIIALTLSYMIPTTAASEIKIITFGEQEGNSVASQQSGWSSTSLWVEEQQSNGWRTTTVNFHQRSMNLSGSSLTERLGNLIEYAESPFDGYDAIHHRAKKRPAKYPTELTIGEIKKWIRDTPGQQHAIGRYQFIPNTLARLQKRLALLNNTRFNKATQDAMAYELYRDAGIDNYRNGIITKDKFMDNLPMIWAGLPLKNGRSAYVGIAGIKDTITRKQFSSLLSL